jgi:translation initiation factor 2 beta subunit (eIF-2beta)/eIF-5
MWANDFDNKQIARELELSPKSVVDWLNKHLGGASKIYEKITLGDQGKKTNQL